MKTITSLDNAFRDFKYALRTLARTPGFTAIAILTLALGIGANTAIFTLLDQVLLRLLPVKNPQELVLLTMHGRHYGSNWGGNAISHPMFRDFAAHNEVFSDMFARFPFDASISFNGQAEHVQLEMVSGTYFSNLGLNPYLGRVFTPEDDRLPDAYPYVILNHAYWKSRFSADPNVVGKTLILNNQNMTIVGVLQPGFDGVELGRSPKLFVPLMMQKEIMVGNPTDMLKERRNRWVNVFGRLKPGITRERAKASLQPFMHSMLEMEVKEKAFAHASPYDRAIPQVLYRSPAWLSRPLLHPPDALDASLGSHGHHRPRPSHCLRQSCQSSPRPRVGAKKGNSDPPGHGGHTPSHHLAAADRKPFARDAGSPRRTRSRLLGRQSSHGRLSAFRFRRLANFHLARSSHSSVHAGRHGRHGRTLRPGSRFTDHQAQRRHDSKRRSRCRRRRWSRRPQKISRHRSGHPFSPAPDRCRSFHQEPRQSSQPRSRF